MNHTARRRRWSLPFVLTAGLLACNTQTAVDPAGPGAGEAARPVEVAKPRPVEPLPQLRAGTRALVAGPTLSGKVVATGADTTHEYLELTLPATGDAVTRWGVLHNSQRNNELFYGGPAAVNWLHSATATNSSMPSQRFSCMVIVPVQQ